MNKCAHCNVKSRYTVGIVAEEAWNEGSPSKSIFRDEMEECLT